MQLNRLVEDDQDWAKEHAISKHREQVSKWPSIEEQLNIRWMGKGSMIIKSLVTEKTKWKSHFKANKVEVNQQLLISDIYDE